jgi:aminoglycoside phosphotransferase (APT) family kinase protein
LDLQQLVAAYQHALHQMHDIVHGDFQHANILSYHDHICGVVNWDQVYAGDSVYDIATLLFYAYDEKDVREQLWHYAFQRADIDLLSVYLAHVLLRQVDCSLRHHDQPTIERYLQRSIALLIDSRHRSS